MNNTITLVLCILLGLAYSPNFHTQVNTEQASQNERYVRITLNEGNTVDGRIVDITEDYFLIDVGLMGSIKIDKRDILNIENIQQESVGELETNQRAKDINPQSSRYFFSPSAHQLKQGDGYYHNVGIMYNSVSFGLHDNMTAGITFTPIGVGGTLKFGGKITENLSISAGGMAVFSFYSSSSPNPEFFRRIDGPLAIPFANITLGSERRNFSFNYGLALLKASIVDSYETDVISRNSHMFNISSMIEITPRAWMLMEAYYIRQLNRDVTTIISEYNIMYNLGPADHSTLLVGFRRANANRTMLWDLGIMNVVWNDVYFPLPWAAITIPL